MEEHIDLNRTQYCYRVTIDKVVEMDSDFPKEYQFFLNLDDQFIKITHLKEKQWFIIYSTNDFNAQFTLLDKERNKE